MVVKRPYGPREWRRRRRQARFVESVLVWLDESEAYLAACARLVGAEPILPFPRDLAREDPGLAVDSVCAYLRSVEAALAGAGSAAAIAVFEEHRPW